MILVVYLRNGIFSSGVAVFFFSKSVFGRSLELPNCGNSEKNVVHLYRSTRVFFLIDVIIIVVMIVLMQVLLLLQ